MAPSGASFFRRRYEHSTRGLAGSSVLVQSVSVAGQEVLLAWSRGRAAYIGVPTTSAAECGAVWTLDSAAGGLSGKPSAALAT